MMNVLQIVGIILKYIATPQFEGLLYELIVGNSITKAQRQNLDLDAALEKAQKEKSTGDLQKVVGELLK